ncbi:hypothetical protein [Methylobacterium sp. NEAU K]|uniref:hypothetical protein n=1 Tax=Methylobacterium sp. NEAU K TaxID=3064946 RepID=UPI002736913B|nr:hypothetical protein [Methylobacterium sp. NEAU K]MDP4002347.1 hypothetical protein [Methylobacterium sp. NEAU K]
MSTNPLHSHTVEVVPCALDPRCFRWIIRADGGMIVERSPYAFVTHNGARISGECWKREHFGEGLGF